MPLPDPISRSSSPSRLAALPPLCSCFFSSRPPPYTGEHDALRAAPFLRFLPSPRLLLPSSPRCLPAGHAA